MLLEVLLVLALAVTATSGATRHPRKRAYRLDSNAQLVAVPRGQPVEIAFAAALNAPAYAPSIANAIHMAVDAHPAIRGFPIQINLSAPRATIQLPTSHQQRAWQQSFALEFGVAPSAFADLYYDAASLLIRDLQQVSTIDVGGKLVVNRDALAHAVCNTTNYQGVSCTITLDPSTSNRLDDPAHSAAAPPDQPTRGRTLRSSAPHPQEIVP